MGRRKLNEHELQQAAKAPRKEPRTGPSTGSRAKEVTEFPVSPAGIRLCEGWAWGAYSETRHRSIQVYFYMRFVSLDSSTNLFLPWSDRKLL